jgi:tRNA-specific 2-thiouridylase
MDKSETRRMAAEMGLNVAAKPDSQDICFVPTGRYTDVIEKLRPDASQPGEMVHMDGRVLGTHRGVMYYTVGQRRGLGLPDGSGLDPLYVIGLDAPNKRVIVGPREALLRSEIFLTDVNWIGNGEFGKTLDGQDIKVKVRSTRPPEPACLVWRDDELYVRLGTPEAGISPGQACVFYDPAGDSMRVLGGGWITRTA